MKNIAWVISVMLMMSVSACADDNDMPDITNELFSGELAEGPNATKALEFKSYLGNAENIHPKVLYFKDSWNGYHFWMAYTPYPLGKTAAENPCIAVSNDGVNWTTPEGLVNPLADAFDEGYNSDTHLVYREDDDVLECWWRPYNVDTGKDAAFRRTTRDGVNWTEAEEVLPYGERYKLRLSPAVIIKDGKYVLFYSNVHEMYEIHCDVEGQRFEWSEPVLVPVPRGDLSLWHHDVIINEDGEYEFVICGYMPGEENNSADLYYVKGNPATNEFTEPVKILARSEDENAIDHRSIYRASLIKENGRYVIYYSSIDKGWHRHMAITMGENLFELHGLSPVENGIPTLLPGQNEGGLISFGRMIRDNSGRLITAWNVVGNLIAQKKGEIELPAGGVYIIGVGNKHYRMKVR